MQSSVVWPTFPGLGGLSVGRDLNIEITCYPPVEVVMATCKQCKCMYLHCTTYVERCHYYAKSRGKLCMRFSIFWAKRTRGVPVIMVGFV